MKQVSGYNDANGSSRLQKVRFRISRPLRIGVITAYPHAGQSKSAIAYYAKTILEPLFEAVPETLVVFGDRLERREAPSRERLAQNARLVRCWRFGITAPVRLFSALWREPVDALHLEYDIYLYGGVVSAVLIPLIMWFLKVFRGTKITTTLHGVVAQAMVTRPFLRQNGFVLPYSRIGKLGFRAIYCLFRLASDRLVVLEPDLRRILIQDYGFDPQKAVVIPLPLMNESPRPDQREAASRQSIHGKRVVTFIGYASFYKGLDVLLDAFERVRTVDPSIELHLVAGAHPRLTGQPKYERFYQQMRLRTRQVGGRHYEFLSDSDLADVLAASSVVVLPYTSAFAGSAALNTALAARRPVLVSSVVYFEGALPLQVFEPNADACANAILQFFKDPEPYIAQVEIQAQRRSVRAIAIANHFVRCGMRLSEMPPLAVEMFR